MKNLFRFAMAVAVLFTASCAKEDISSSIGGGEVEVTFTANLADMGTRAYGDGTSANVVFVGVYETGSKTPLKLVNYTEGYPVVGKQATITLVLLKDKKYDLVFWAQNNAQTCYGRNWEDRSITVNYKGAKAQDETRDAFFLVKNNWQAGKDETTFELRRPFAQLRAGISQADFDYIKANGSAGIATSAAVVEGVANVLNLNNEAAEVYGDVTATFDVADVAAGDDEKFAVNGVDYYQLSMNYLLVREKTLVDVTYTFADDDTTYTRPYYNVPVQRNYRTNIIGQLISSPLDFTVIIKPEFEGDENYDILGRLKEVLANGGDLVLFSDVTLDEPITIPADKEVNIDLSKYSLTIGAGITVNGALKMSNGQVKVNVEQDGNSDVYVGLKANSGSSIDFEDVKVSVANKNAAVYTYADDVEINLTNTNMTVGEDGHGVFVPQGANNLKVNLVNSTINAVKDGYYGLYLMQTNSTVSIDEDSEINDFWVMGGNVNVVYGGEKPEVKTDGLAVTITYYTEDAWAIKNAILNGGEFTLTEDVVLESPLNILADITINLNGKTISAAVAKGDGAVIEIAEGVKAVIYGGTVKSTNENGDAAINNAGELVLQNVTIEGAPLADGGHSAYAVVSSGNLIIEEGTAVSADRGCLKFSGDGKTVINGGHFTNNDIGTRNLTSHVVDVEDGGTHKLTINGGTFEHLHSATSGGVVICNRTTGTVYVNGGNYSGGNYYGNDNLSDYGYGGTFVVTGGTYTSKPATKYIADGYHAVQDSGKYVVVSEDINGVASTPIVNKEGSTYEGEFFENPIQDALIFQNWVFYGDATIYVNRTYGAVILENVKGNINGDAIVVDNDNNSVMILENVDLTLAEGKKLIKSTKTIYQVFMANITINGVKQTQESIAQYLENVGWYQVVDEI